MNLRAIEKKAKQPEKEVSDRELLEIIEEYIDNDAAGTWKELLHLRAIGELYRPKLYKSFLKIFRFAWKVFLSKYLPFLE